MLTIGAVQSQSLIHQVFDSQLKNPFNYIIIWISRNPLFIRSSILSHRTPLWKNTSFRSQSLIHQVFDSQCKHSFRHGRCCYYVAIPYSSGLRFSGETWHGLRGIQVLVAIPYSSGLRFSAVQLITILWWMLTLSQSLIHQVFDSQVCGKRLFEQHSLSRNPLFIRSSILRYRCWR